MTQKPKNQMLNTRPTSGRVLRFGQGKLRMMHCLQTKTSVSNVSRRSGGISSVTQDRHYSYIPVHDTVNLLVGIHLQHLCVIFPYKNERNCYCTRKTIAALNLL